MFASNASCFSCQMWGSNEQQMNGGRRKMFILSTCKRKCVRETRLWDVNPYSTVVCFWASITCIAPPVVTLFHCLAASLGFHHVHCPTDLRPVAAPLTGDVTGDLIFQLNEAIRTVHAKHKHAPLFPDLLRACYQQHNLTDQSYCTLGCSSYGVRWWMNEQLSAQRYARCSEALSVSEEVKKKQDQTNKKTHPSRDWSRSFAQSCFSLLFHLFDHRSQRSIRPHAPRCYTWAYVLCVFGKHPDIFQLMTCRYTHV